MYVYEEYENWVHLLIFLAFYSTVTTWKGPRKSHGKVIEFYPWISVWTMGILMCYTPFAKSNGLFFPDTKINMMP